MAKSPSFNPEQFGEMLGMKVKQLLADAVAPIQQQLAVMEHRLKELEAASKSTKTGGRK